MRLVFRLLGTWMLGLAVILIVMDGTRSLGANAVLVSSLGEVWRNVHPPSLEAVSAFFETRFFSNLLDGAFAVLLSYPAFAVVGLPGVLLALMGRRRNTQRFVTTDQI